MSPSEMHCRFLNILLFFHVILSSFYFSSTGVLLPFPLQSHCQKDDNHSPTEQATALPKKCSLWFVLFSMRTHCWFTFSPASTKISPEYQHQYSTRPIDSQPILKHGVKPPAHSLFKLYEVSFCPGPYVFRGHSIFFLSNNCIFPFKLYTDKGPQSKWSKIMKNFSLTAQLKYLQGFN